MFIGGGIGVKQDLSSGRGLAYPLFLAPVDIEQLLKLTAIPRAAVAAAARVRQQRGPRACSGVIIGYQTVRTRRVDGSFVQMGGSFVQISRPFRQMNVPLGLMSVPFGRMGGSFSQLDGRLSQIGGSFSKMDGGTSKMNGSFSKMDAPFSKMDSLPSAADTFSLPGPMAMPPPVRLFRVE
jgi:hypothetical protein